MQGNFTILGAGAMGSILGAHLARAGHSVAMIARGHRARQIVANGLRIVGLADFSVPVQVVEHASELRNSDVLIVAMKAHRTAATLKLLSHFDLDVAFSIQNGIQKVELVANAFGRNRILGALADLSGELLPTGDVLFTRNVSLMMGELAGGVSRRASRIAKILNAAGIRASAVPNVLSLEWSKFVAWAGLVMLAVTTRAKTWQFLSDSNSALLLVRMIHEFGALAKAVGVDLPARSIIPVTTILSSSEVDGVALVQKTGLDYRKMTPEHRMSALQDLHAHRPLELNETVGYALQMAGSTGVPMVLTESLYRLAVAVDRIESMRPADQMRGLLAGASYQ